jgi:hypothetical protein
MPVMNERLSLPPLQRFEKRVQHRRAEPSAILEVAVHIVVDKP